MTHRYRAGLEILTHLDEDLVRGCAHQRDQLAAVLPGTPGVRRDAPRCWTSSTSRDRSTRTPTVATVLADGDLGVGGLIGAGHRTELAADRQLPDVGLGFQEIAALAEGEQVQRAP